MQHVEQKQSQYFQLQQLAEGVYAAKIEEGQGAWANAGIIDLGDATLVFDTFLTPAAARDLKQVAEQLFGREVRYVVNSHWHLDHTMGNQVFSNAVILSTKTARELLGGGFDLSDKDAFAQGIEQDIQEMTRLRDTLSDPRTVQSMQNEIKEMTLFGQAVPELEVTLLTVTFEKELTIHGTKRSVQLVSYGGGHSASDAFLYLSGEKIAFMGDLVFVNTHPSIHKQPVPEWIRILEQIKSLELKSIVPGHGEVGDYTHLDVMIDYLTVLYEQVQRYVENGGTLEEINQLPIPAKYEKWGRFKHVHQWNVRNVYNQLMTQN